MRIVDAHHHLWDLDRHDYPWLEKGGRHWAGDLSGIAKNYFLDDLFADAAGLDLAKSVHVQAQIAPEEATAETAWLQSIADAPGSRGFPHGLVGFADLAADDVEEVLERHCEHRNMRGIRHLLNYDPNEPDYCRAPRGDLMHDPAWRRGYALLERFGLSFDLQIEWRQADDAVELLRAFPGIQAILDHTGFPRRNDAGSVTGWRLAMYKLATCPNLAVKISGLAQMQFDWTEDTIRPFVLDTVDIFGAERCLFASNFPVDKLKVDYAKLWRTFDRITADLSEDERRGLFADNATRVYRL